MQRSGYLQEKSAFRGVAVDQDKLPAFAHFSLSNDSHIYV